MWQIFFPNILGTLKALSVVLLIIAHAYRDGVWVAIMKRPIKCEIFTPVIPRPNEDSDSNDSEVEM